MNNFSPAMLPSTLRPSQQLTRDNFNRLAYAVRKMNMGVQPLQPEIPWSANVPIAPRALQAQEVFPAKVATTPDGSIDDDSDTETFTADVYANGFSADATLTGVTVNGPLNSGAALTVDQEILIYLDAAGTYWYEGVGSSQNISMTVTQDNAFSPGDAITAAPYDLAKADSAADAEAIGIISSATDTQFTVVLAGVITGLSSLTPGTVYFLSATSAGELTPDEPTTNGQVTKPMLVALSETSGIVINFRGEVLGPGLEVVYQ
jgi:hypothetical protein